MNGSMWVVTKLRLFWENEWKGRKWLPHADKIIQSAKDYKCWRKADGKNIFLWLRPFLNGGISKPLYFPFDLFCAKESVLFKPLQQLYLCTFVIRTSFADLGCKHTLTFYIMTIYYPTIPRLKERLYIASSGHSILIYCQSSTIPDRPGIASSNTFCHCPDVKRSNCAPKIITMTACATDTFNDSSSLSAACQAFDFGSRWVLPKFSGAPWDPLGPFLDPLGPP